ncbi:MAG: ComEC/Rec2 family competence protein [Pirellulales bacterium]
MATASSANANRLARPPGVVYEPLVIALTAACAGVAADRLLPWGAGWWWLTVMALAGWWWLWRRGSFRAASAILWLSILSLFAAWNHLHWFLADAHELALFAQEEPSPAALEVVAVSGPRRSPAPPFDPLRAIPRVDHTRLEVAVRGIRDGGGWRPASGRALLIVDGHLLGVHAGDRLRLFGHVARPRSPGNPGEFDFSAHARGQGRLSLIRCDFPDCVSVLTPGHRLGWRGFLAAMRSVGDALLWRSLHAERSGLAAALLLGAREELDQERSDAFLKTGTVHVLAISGMHIAILAGALFWGLRIGMLPRRASLLAVALVTVLYTVLTDSQPSAVRAMVLVIVVCIAQMARRPVSAVNSLAAAALVVLAINPGDLFSIGAQLSFLAVAALIWFGRWWEARYRPDALAQLIAETRPWPVRWVRFVRDWAWKLTLSSLAVWLVTAPLVMARFHLLSPAAILLTPLTWIPAALALLSGFGLLTLGWLLPPLGTVLAFVCDANLAVLDGLVTRTAALPGSHAWVPGPDGWWLTGLYAGMFAWFALPHLRLPPRWTLSAAAGWSSVGLALPWLAMWPSGDRPLECGFLSVGHGCAVVLHLPEGQTLLYDAGSLGSPHGAAQSVSSYLWSRGITHLDGVIVSHADVDHYNGVPELLERFSVGVVYVSPVMFHHPSAALDKLQAALAAADVPLRELSAGQQLRLPDGAAGRVEVLHPPGRGVYGSDNANSLVLAVEWHGRRVLLTGDLETPGLDDLLEEEPWDCDVLLAPHHGSIRSNPPGMAAWSRPEWVAISGGFGDSRSTADAYLKAGASVLHTAYDGAMLVRLDRAGVEVRSWKRRDQH